MKKLCKVLFPFFCIDFNLWKKQDTSHLPRFPKVIILKKNEILNGAYTVRVETYWDQKIMHSMSKSEARIMTCITTKKTYESLSTGQIVWAMPSRFTNAQSNSTVVGHIPITCNFLVLLCKISLREITPSKYFDIFHKLHFKRNTLPWAKTIL